MDVLACFSHVFGHVREEGDDVVLGGLFDLLHSSDVELSPRLDLSEGPGGDLAQLGPGFAHRDLDLEPGGHAGLGGPQGRHLGGGVAFDHQSSGAETSVDPPPGDIQHSRSILAASMAALRAPLIATQATGTPVGTVSYTHLRAHETVLDLVCRLLLE